MGNDNDVNLYYRTSHDPDHPVYTLCYTPSLLRVLFLIVENAKCFQNTAQLPVSWHLPMPWSIHQKHGKSQSPSSYLIPSLTFLFYFLFSYVW